MPIHHIFETNPNGSEKYSGAKTIDAVSARKAADLYQYEFKPVAHASHLMVTTEGGTQELIALGGVSLPPLHEARPAFAAETREAPPSFAAETRETTNPTAEETCGWSTFCWVIGWMNLFLGGVGLLMMLLAGSKDGLVLLISGVAGGLSILIFGYIIQLLFDCRRYLRRMTER